MDCPYCTIIQRVSQETVDPDLPGSRWIAILQALHKLRVRQVVLTGGEPTLHPDVEMIARRASRDMLVSLISNGRFLFNSNAGTVELLSHIDLISLSIDAFVDAQGELLDDDLRAAGDHLVREGLNKELILTITRQNLPTLTGIARRAVALGFSIRLSLVHPGAKQHTFRGDATGTFAPGVQDVPALEALVRTLEELRKSGAAIADSSAFLAGLPQFAGGNPTVTCPAGLRTMEVNSDGLVQACQDSPASGLTPEDLAEMSDPDSLLQRTIIPGCQCHYSNYHRLTQGRILWTASRLKALLIGNHPSV
jgi:MoaA/NifB/PqqE/SkfB family radical SAM enzyme